VLKPVSDYADLVRRAGVLTLFVAIAAVAAVAAFAGTSARAVRASIIDAAKAQQSVHYVAKQVSGNSVTTLTGDVEVADGVQHVTIKIGKKTAHFTIVVIDQTAYFQGDELGLQLGLGLTKTQATTYAGQWISIPKGDKLYAGTAAFVTLDSVIQLITPHGRLAAAKAKYHGTRVIAVRGLSGKRKKKEAQILIAPAHGKHLPLEEDELAPGVEYISHTALSKWNEPVQVQAPATSTPIATVRGG
jgi:hypothetical protein